MSARRERQLSAAVGKIHEAARAPEAWPAALESISHCFDDPKVCLFGVDLCHANSAAVNTLYHGDGLRIEQNRLGVALPEVADALGSLLQAVFEKTGTHRQADLMQLPGHG